MNGRRGYNARLSKRKRERRVHIIILGAVILGVILIFFIVKGILGGADDQKAQKTMLAAQVSDVGAPLIDVQLLTPNEYSRPGTALEKVNYVVIHYTANPGSTAKNNRDYFEGLKNSHETKASSHFVVGTAGEIIQCIPSSEMSYASNKRNKDSVSIESCHLDETGQFTNETYQSLVQLTAWLCKKFNLTSKDVIRHFDVTEKICPKYFVDNQDAWKQYLKDVDVRIDEITEMQKQQGGE